MKTSNTRFWKRLLGAGATVIVGLQACGDSTEEARKLIELGGRCSINSDCEGELVCAFGHCHEACTQDKDCITLGGGRCMKVPGQDEPGVCQLDELKGCSKHDDCPGKQVCAIDGECRDLCSVTEPCVSDDLVCSTSGFCARETEVDASGELIGATGQGGNGGASGDGGTSGRGGGSSGGGGGGGGDSNAGGDDGGSGASAGDGSGGTPSTGGASGAAGNASGGTAGTSGAGGFAGGGVSGAAGASAGSGGLSGMGGSSGGSAVNESEPNSQREQANPVEPGVDVLGTLGAIDDKDFYEVTTPSAPAAGGYFEVGVTDLPSGLFALRLWSKVASTTFLDERTSMSGNAMWAFFAAAPGEPYLIEVAAFSSGQPHPYRLTVSYVPIPDPFEPNDTRTQAVPITLGQAVNGYLFTGLRANTVSSAEYDDWYEIELQPGEVTLSLTSVPADLSTRVYLYGLQAQLLDDNPQGTGGADNVLTYDVQSGGTHWVRVGTYVPSPVAVSRTPRPGDVPENFLDSYTLTVTQ